MKQIKFKTPIAMECTQEQYDKDLKQPLKELGYLECDMDREGNRCNILSTNWGDSKRIGLTENVNTYDYLIPTYHPKLFISLAGMTEGEDWIVGEWFKCVSSRDFCFTKGKLYQAREEKNKGNILHIFSDDDDDFNGYGISNFIKATKEELIEHFTEEVEVSNYDKQDVEVSKYCFNKTIEKVEKFLEVEVNNTIRDRILKRLDIPSNYDKDDYEMTQYCLNDVIELVEEFLDKEEETEQPMQYKGEIEGFPQYVVEAMLDEQERQGNKRDVTVFEKNNYADVNQKGFNWSDSVLGRDAWKDIIENRQFHLIEEPKPQQPKKDRFPFTLSLEEAKRIINVARPISKVLLAQEWGENLLLDGKVEVSEEYYKELRGGFNTETTYEQNLVLDEIFGKDEEFIIWGTPCLVKVVMYADGKGGFYNKIRETVNYEVLEINYNSDEQR